MIFIWNIIFHNEYPYPLIKKLKLNKKTLLFNCVKKLQKYIWEYLLFAFDVDKVYKILIYQMINTFMFICCMIYIKALKNKYIIFHYQLNIGLNNGYMKKNFIATNIPYKNILNFSI